MLVVDDELKMTIGIGAALSLKGRLFFTWNVSQSFLFLLNQRVGDVGLTGHYITHAASQISLLVPLLLLTRRPLGPCASLGVLVEDRSSPSISSLSSSQLSGTALRSCG